jgi:hypothetical protein
VGGGVAAIQQEANPPSNLVMKAQYYGPQYSTPFVCTPIYSKTYYREWAYGAALLEIDSTSFTENDVGLNQTKAAFGGALHLSNLRTTLRRTNISSNTASGVGGAVHIAAGSGSVHLQDRTHIVGNRAGESGSSIYSASGGDIIIDSGSVVDFANESETSGVAVLSGGKFTIAPDAALRCAQGEQLYTNFSTFATSFSDWAIDCNIVRAKKNGSILTYANPTCEQITYPGASAIHTYPCDGLPLMPQMLTSTGTLSCVPCGGGLYSLQRAQQLGDRLEQCQCERCPYGAKCDGGDRLMVRRHFWLDVDSNGASVCPPGYCCADSEGCDWKEKATVCAHHRDPTAPLCGGCPQGRSQAIDSNACVLNEECGQFARFLIPNFCYWLLYDVYALYNAR